MRVLWLDNLNSDRGLDSTVCAALYASAAAEEELLFHGGLDVRDPRLVAEVAELFDLDPGICEDFVVEPEAHAVREADERRWAAAGAKLKDRAWGLQVTFVPIHDPAAVAEAFKLDKETKDRLFGGRPIRTADGSFAKRPDGKWSKSRATDTGMPTWKPARTGIRAHGAVPDGPGAQLTTVTQRKQLAAELGCAKETVRVRDRDAVKAGRPQDFWAWVEGKRQKLAAKTAKPKPIKRRYREPGKEDAVLTYARLIGRSERTAYYRLKGLDEHQVRCLIKDLREDWEQEPQARRKRSRRGKQPVNFPSDCSDSRDTDCSDNCSDKNAESLGIHVNPAHETPTLMLQSVPADMPVPTNPSTVFRFTPRTILIRPSHLHIVRTGHRLDQPASVLDLTGTARLPVEVRAA